MESNDLIGGGYSSFLDRYDFGLFEVALSFINLKLLYFKSNLMYLSSILVG